MSQVHEKSIDLKLPLSGLDQAFGKYLQQMQSSNNPLHELLAALTSYQFGQGHACLDLNLLDLKGVNLFGWNASLKALLPTGLAAAAHSSPWITGDASPLVLDGHRLYLRRNWNAEKSIQGAIDARLRSNCDVPEDISKTLDLLFPKQSPANAEGSYLNSMPDWQKVACALAARKRLTLITGGPGTGKTTTVVRLLALLQFNATRDGRILRIALAAPTGKAAARLGESIASAVNHLPEAMRPTTLSKAVTLHKLLQIRANSTDIKSQELAVDLVIVDEASMIDLEMMARLLAAVPLTSSLILLGDKDQLSSVEAGAVMAQLCDGAEAGNYSAETRLWIESVTGVNLTTWGGHGSALAQQTVMLRLSRRFKDDSGIGQWAKAVNVGDYTAVRNLWHDTPAYAPMERTAVDRLQCNNPQDSRLTALVTYGWREWLKLVQSPMTKGYTDDMAITILSQFAKFQVLCAVRENLWGVEALNKRIAKCLGFLDDGWYVGRPVMVTRNDYNLSLMNGDVGLCLPHASGLRVAFPNGQGGVHWVLPSRLDAVESVFAMTVHKSQGSEFEHVCIVLPETPVAVLTRELLYTGLTRAKNRLTLVVPEVAVLWHAINAKVLRSGGLQQLANTPETAASLAT